MAVLQRFAKFVLLYYFTTCTYLLINVHYFTTCTDLLINVLTFPHQVLALALSTSTR